MTSKSAGMEISLLPTRTRQVFLLHAGCLDKCAAILGFPLIRCISSRLQIKRYNSTGGFLGDFFEGLETDTLKDMYFGDCPNMFTPQIESKENDTKVWSALLLI